ncbi:alpha/beta-hydrolase [Imleria badia]|nr:alpha/beta-hydrolase [Imleria badia]
MNSVVAWMGIGRRSRTRSEMIPVKRTTLQRSHINSNELSVLKMDPMGVERGRAILLSLAILGHASSQSVLSSAANSQSAYAAPYDDGSVKGLGALSMDSFTTIGHPLFPNYSVRIKKTGYKCGNQKAAYTGYIDIQARHLFFYFFESRNDPAKDDIIFWTNGGPGYSSSMGLFMENGPCSTLESVEPVYNPYSWTTNANMFWVDQPVGTGFSYADYGEYVSTTEEASKDGRPFHMAGESYAGVYLPVFASRVYDQNAQLVAAKVPPINLRSVMIGNGWVDYYTLYPTYIDIQCTNASVAPPVSNISTCLRMKKALPLCQKWTRESCIDVFDALSCSAARNYCSSELYKPLAKDSGLNKYDITKKCLGDPADYCYPATKNMTEYLSRNTTRAALGVDKAAPGFTVYNPTIDDAFAANLDQFHETYTEIAQLLERGVRVLVYAGTHDWICNWLSNEIWTLNMPWSGQQAFASQPLRDWQFNGVVAGQTRSANGLMFITFYEAGHMVGPSFRVGRLYLI